MRLRSTRTAGAQTQSLFLRVRFCPRGNACKQLLLTSAGSNIQDRKVQNSLGGHNTSEGHNNPAVDIQGKRTPGVALEAEERVDSYRNRSAMERDRLDWPLVPQERILPAQTG